MPAAHDACHFAEHVETLRQQAARTVREIDVERIRATGHPQATILRHIRSMPTTPVAAHPAIPRPSVRKPRAPRRRVAVSAAPPTMAPSITEHQKANGRGSAAVAGLCWSSARASRRAGGVRCAYRHPTNPPYAFTPPYELAPTSTRRARYATEMPTTSTTLPLPSRRAHEPKASCAMMRRRSRVPPKQVHDASLMPSDNGHALRPCDAEAGWPRRCGFSPGTWGISRSGACSSIRDGRRCLPMR
jgi:hypothetical protein